MIRLSNGHTFEYVAASGALAFDGEGWPWEQPLRRISVFDPKLFTIITKTLTRHPRKGNMRGWHRPFQAVRFLDSLGNSDVRAWCRTLGTVNAVGLTNPGIEFACKKFGLKWDDSGYDMIVSIASEDIAEFQEMAQMLNGNYGLKGFEINASCPNTQSELLKNTKLVIDAVWAVKEVVRLPLLLKLSAAHDYLAIENETRGLAEAISVNSVPWNVMFPGKGSPLKNLGGGGVSGKIAQPHTWKMVSDLAAKGRTPVIAPSIWDFSDIEKARALGASAISFGSIFLRYPWRPTAYVRREMRQRK